MLDQTSRCHENAIQMAKLTVRLLEAWTHTQSRDLALESAVSPLERAAVSQFKSPINIDRFANADESRPKNLHNKQQFQNENERHDDIKVVGANQRVVQIGEHAAAGLAMSAKQEENALSKTQQNLLLRDNTNYESCTHQGQKELQSQYQNNKGDAQNIEEPRALSDETQQLPPFKSLPEVESSVKRKRGRPPKNKALQQDIKVTNGFAAPIPMSSDNATPHQRSDITKTEQADIKFQLDQNGRIELKRAGSGRLSKIKKFELQKSQIAGMVSVEENTRPSTEKNDSEEKAVLSKEPVKHLTPSDHRSPESSHASASTFRKAISVTQNLRSEVSQHYPTTYQKEAKVNLVLGKNDNGSNCSPIDSQLETRQGIQDREKSMNEDQKHGYQGVQSFSNNSSKPHIPTRPMNQHSPKIQALAVSPRNQRQRVFSISLAATLNPEGVTGDAANLAACYTSQPDHQSERAKILGKRQISNLDESSLRNNLQLDEYSINQVNNLISPLLTHRPRAVNQTRAEWIRPSMNRTVNYDINEDHIPYAQQYHHSYGPYQGNLPQAPSYLQQESSSNINQEHDLMMISPRPPHRSKMNVAPICLDMQYQYPSEGGIYPQAENTLKYNEGPHRRFERSNSVDNMMIIISPRSDTNMNENNSRYHA